MSRAIDFIYLKVKPSCVRRDSVPLLLLRYSRGVRHISLFCGMDRGTRQSSIDRKEKLYRDTSVPAEERRVETNEAHSPICHRYFTAHFLPIALLALSPYFAAKSQQLLFA